MRRHVLMPRRWVWPRSLNKLLIKRLQRRLNSFFSKHLDGFSPLIVDGKMGHLTRRYIVLAKFYLGQVGARSTKVNRNFMKRLARPNDASLTDEQHVRRGQRRRKEHNEAYHDSKNHYDGTPGWATYDGKMVAEYFVPINNWARHEGAIINGRRVIWKGVVVSGGRTPAYSTGLCIAKCGRPTCPGTCAGATSNHAGNDPKKVPCGAEDVSDYATFGLLMKHCPFQKLGAPVIFNTLPNDPVHFSPRGN